MKHCAALFFLLLSTATAIAQNNGKVRIALLGTVHFTPSTQDLYKNKALNLTEDKRRAQIRKLVKQLSAFRPNKICIEMPPNKQAQTDSIYRAYLNGHYKLAQNEIDQVGFQTAKQLRLQGLTCVNYFAV